MSKAVLLSIHPRWCELIAAGKKTVEVRKTRPKIKTPFKCYIYMTKSYDTLFGYGKPKKLCVSGGYVIGEFVCYSIFPIRVFENGTIQDYMFHNVAKSCVPYDEIAKYIGNGKTGYGWRISDLVIYDEPRELVDFIVPSKIGCCNDGKCRGCRWFDRGNGFNLEDDCNAKFNTDEYKPLRKAPQSWCYVEEIGGAK